MNCVVILLCLVIVPEFGKYINRTTNFAFLYLSVGLVPALGRSVYVIVATSAKIIIVFICRV